MGRRAALAAAALLLACWSSEPQPPDASEPAVPAPAQPPEAEPAPAPPPLPAPVPAPPVPVHPAPPPPAEPAEPSPPELDLDGLAEAIEATPAIGVFTKLALRNDIDDLLEALSRFHRDGKGKLDNLRNRFEALTLKLQALLEPEEPALAASLARSREAIWGLLADPESFARLRR